MVRRAFLAAVALILWAPPVAAGVTRASVGTGGGDANGESFFPALSADGRYVSFVSTASNLVPGDSNGVRDAFVRDSLTGTTERISVTSAGVQATSDTFGPTSISADGRFVAFQSGADLAPGAAGGNTNVFVRDRLIGTTERITSDTGFGPSLSADGTRVAYYAFVEGAGFFAAFVHDRTTGATVPVSVDANGVLRGGTHTAISGDGGTVAFSSQDPLLDAADANGGTIDIFARDLATATTELVSVDDAGAQSFGNTGFASLGATGNVVAFLATSDGSVFVRDRLLRTTRRIGTSFVPPVLAAAAPLAVFGTTTVLVRDLAAGTTLTAAAAPPREQIAISAGGGAVALATVTALTPTDMNGVADIYVVPYPPSTANDTSPPLLRIPLRISRFATSPEGATVTFVATATDDTDPNPIVVCEPRSGTVFPIGTTSVTCTATDAAGNSTSRSFDVRVLGAPELIAFLVFLVDRSVTEEGLRASLISKLNAAAAAVERGSTSACGALVAFEHEVEAQAEKALTTSEAMRLANLARQARAVLACR